MLTNINETGKKQSLTKKNLQELLRETQEEVKVKEEQLQV